MTPRVPDSGSDSDEVAIQKQCAESKAESDYNTRCIRRLDGLERKLYSAPSVPVSSLPALKAKGDPMFSANPCLRCAKLAGTKGLVCIRDRLHKCFRCANNGDPCEPIPARFKDAFRRVQGHFQAGKLKKAFAAREKWVIEVTAYTQHEKRKKKESATSLAGSASVGLSEELKSYLDRQFFLFHRTIERFLNVQLEAVSACSLDLNMALWINVLMR